MESSSEPERNVDAKDPRVGTVVDKYELVRCLGRGGMGAVYEGRHLRLARRAAVKFLLPEYAANPEVLRRFENEARAAGGLEHPNLAAVVDLGKASDGATYLVMEYLEGEDCASLLQRVGKLPATRAVDLVVQACRGLAVAHAAGIVHRDLKPENLFLTRAGDGSDWVKVLDFGIAKLRAMEAQAVTRSGMTMGTAYYMSPEQARGASSVDERTDVWALGVVLYQLLTGRRPFEGEQFLHIIYQILSSEPPALHALCDKLPDGLVRVVGAALAKDVQDRFPTVTAFAEALAPFAAAASRQALRPYETLLPSTVPTPANTITPVALNASLLHERGVSGDKVQSPRTVASSVAPDVASGVSRRLTSVYVGAALLASGAVAFWLSWPSTKLASETPAPAAASFLPAIATTTPPVVSATGALASARASDADTAPSLRNEGVSRVSEQRGRGSNTSSLGAGSAVSAALSVTAPPASVAPLTSRGRAGRPTLQIEEDNPYQ